MSSIDSSSSSLNRTSQSTSIELETVAKFDSELFINTKLAPQRAEMDIIDVNIKEVQNHVSSLDEFRTQISEFKESVELLISNNNFTDESVFSMRTASLTSTNASITPSSYVSVEVTGNAIEGNHTIIVHSVAQNQISSIGDLTNTINVSDLETSVTEASGTPFKPGSFKINGEAIDIEAGDSLLAIQSKINTQSDTTGVEAYLIKLNETNDYTIQFQSTQEGLSNAFTIEDLSNVTDNLTVTDLQSSSDASITFNAQTITRSSNIFDDLLQGININTLNSSSGEKISLNIQPDKESIATAFQNMVTKYNTIQDFMAAQTERSSKGLAAPTAHLIDSLSLAQGELYVGSSMSTSLAYISQAPFASFAEIGMSLEAKFLHNQSVNNIKFDSVKLYDALQGHPEDISKSLGYYFEDSANILIMTSNGYPDNLSIENYRFDIDHTNPVGKQVSIYDASNTFLTYANFEYDPTNNTGVITGVEGTFLENGRILYNGDGKDSTQVSGHTGAFYNLNLKLDALIDMINTERTQNTNTLVEYQTDKAELEEEINTTEDRVQSSISYYQGLVAKHNLDAQIFASITNANNNK